MSRKETADRLRKQADEIWDPQSADARNHANSVWQRMRHFGLWLQGDGEPVALTPKGLLWLNERTA